MVMKILNEQEVNYFTTQILAMIQIAETQNCLGNKKALPKLARDIVTIMQTCLMVRMNTPLHLVLNANERVGENFVGLFTSNEEALEYMEKQGVLLEDSNSPYIIEEVKVS
jgi:hypothetical protein